MKKGDKVKTRFGQSNPPKYKHGIFNGNYIDNSGRVWSEILWSDRKGKIIAIKRKPEELILE